MNESIEEKHARFKEALLQFDEPWGYKGKVVPDAPDIGDNLTSVVELAALSSRGSKSYIVYNRRDSDYLKDNAQYDDNVIIEFRSEAADLRDFVKHVLPTYIETFDCYRASIVNRTVARSDWPSVVELCNSTGKDVNGRDNIYRVNEINFYDRELCKRAFGLSPEKIVQCLDGKIEHVSLFHGGILLVYSSQLMPVEKLVSIGSEVKALLKGRGRS